MTSKLTQKSSMPPQGHLGAVAGKEGMEFENNPEVDDAAGFAVQQLSAQSNSLSPFTLKRVLSAHAEPHEEGVLHKLKLRVGQGAMPDQDFEVEVASTPRSHHLKRCSQLSPKAGR